MAIFDFLSGLIAPVTDLVGKIVTKDEDKMRIQAAILEVQTKSAEKYLDYEAKILDLQAATIQAETKSESWLTQSWRPITMLVFVGLVSWSYIGRTFGAPVPDLPPQMWSLIELGLGGYVIGRSAEKIVPTVIDAMKKKDNATP